MVRPSIRPMRPQEARRFLEIHHDAVRGLAAGDYPAEVIDAWATLPITEEAIARFLRNRDDEIRLMAEIDDEPVGIGALVLGLSELRACYVLTRAARRGVGTAIVVEIERIARQHGLGYLQLESSLNAEPFYSAMGFEVQERGHLLLRPQLAMAAIKMRKQLA